MRRPMEEKYAFRDSDSSELKLPPGKRRKTLADALSAIRISPASSLDNGGGNITNRRNAETNDSLAPANEFMIDREDDDEESHSNTPLSDKAKFERDIARALVFGGAPPRPYYFTPPQEDPVEQKICNLIRGSLRNAIRQESSQVSAGYSCDMDVETSYNRSSVGFSDEQRRPRSNSLPTREYHLLSTNESMDID